MLASAVLVAQTFAVEPQVNRVVYNASFVDLDGASMSLAANQKAARLFSRTASYLAMDPGEVIAALVEMAGIEPASATFALKRLQA